MSIDAKPTLGASVIDTAIREHREATDNDLGLDNRPLRAALTRLMAPSLLVPRDEIWLRRHDNMIEKIKVASE